MTKMHRHGEITSSFKSNLEEKPKKEKNVDIEERKFRGQLMREMKESVIFVHDLGPFLYIY